MDADERKLKLEFASRVGATLRKGLPAGAAAVADEPHGPEEALSEALLMVGSLGVSLKSVVEVAALISYWALYGPGGPLEAGKQGCAPQPPTESSLVPGCRHAEDLDLIRQNIGVAMGREFPSAYEAVQALIADRERLQGAGRRMSQVLMRVLAIRDAVHGGASWGGSIDTITGQRMERMMLRAVGRWVRVAGGGR